MTTALIIFAITYVLLLSFQGVRHWIALCSALVFIVLGIMPIGASANITGIGILRKAGYEVKTSDFLKIGIPFSLVAVISGYLLIWLIWA